MDGTTLGLGEQADAPVDRRTQCALAFGRVAGAADEQRERAVEAGDELGRGEEPDARGRELERQRQAVEPPADLADVRRAAGIEHEAGSRS